MANIGVDTGTDTLVLWKGRDFRWNFDHLDPVTKEPTDYPAGDLLLEIATGGEHNARQAVTVYGATDGTYTFTLDGQTTSAIDYYDATTNPHDMDGDITDALEALSNVGAGNVVVYPAQLFPVWELAVTLNTGQNEIQKVLFTGNPTGGKFKLAYGLSYTAALSYGASAATVQTALEGLSGIGSGNVSVAEIPDGYQIEFIGTLAATDVDQITASPIGIDFSEPGGFYSLSGGFFPGMTVSTVRPGTSKLTEQFVNLLNQSVNDLFNTFDSLLGVDIDFYITDETNITLTVTSLRAYVEHDIITFNTNVTSNMVKNAINQALGFAGILSTVSVDFWWNHHYEVEFIGDLAETAQSALVPNITNLVGDNKRIDVEVIDPGKSHYTVWPFVISGSTAQLKVESEDADLVPNRSEWQLFFLPDGEAAGGDPIARGRVQRVGR